MKHDAAYAEIARRHSNIPQDALPLGLEETNGATSEARTARQLPRVRTPEVRALAEAVERRDEEVAE